MATLWVRANRCVTVVTLCALALTGCNARVHGQPLSADDARPRSGGVLRLAGVADIEHLDPASVDSPAGGVLLRALSRQLLAYPPTSAGAAPAARPLPDLAEALAAPTAGGTVYTFRLRSGPAWSTTPPRPVTAPDVVRGFQRLCGPGVATAAPPYVIGLIAGLTQYCAGLALLAPAPATVKAYLATHTVSGVRALDDRTVQFTLTRPASDFPEILSRPYASPMPVESLDDPPDSTAFRQHFVSSGPYQIDQYVPGRTLALTRNPAWRSATDPLRHAYVDRITVSLGQDAAGVRRALVGGSADLSWNTDVSAADLDALAAKQGAGTQAGLAYAADAGGLWYLAMNFRSANYNHAIANLGVRRALNYAVDKQEITQILGGARLYQPADQLLAPAARGYQQFNLYPTPDHRGDPATAAQLLADAGYPRGVTLALSYPTDSVGVRVAVALRDQLARVGITLRLDAQREGGAADRYRTDRSDPMDQPDTGFALGSDWDLSLRQLEPALPGLAGRSVFTTLLGDLAASTATNDDGYAAEEAVHTVAQAALAALSTGEAASAWAQADKLAMRSAPWVPLATGRLAEYRGAAVRGWACTPVLPRGDLTNVWLTQGR